MTTSELQVEGALETCKNLSQSNSTLPEVTKGSGNDTDFGAVMYIIAVLTFYSLGIVVMIVKYLKTERKEMEEEMVLDSFFKGIPNKKIEHEIESVNRVAIHAFHTLTAAKAGAPPKGSVTTSLESGSHLDHCHLTDARDLEDQSSTLVRDGHLGKGYKQTCPLPQSYSPTGVNLAVDQQFCLHPGGQRNRRRVSYRTVEEGLVDSEEMCEFFDLDAKVTFNPDSEKVNFNDGPFPLNDTREHDIQYCDETNEGDLTLDSKRKIEEPPRIYINENVSGQENDKTSCKKSKTVIFSGETEPSQNKTPQSGVPVNRCLKPTICRRYSDSTGASSLAGGGISPNGSISHVDASLRHTLDADALPLNINQGRPSRFQRRFQVEPVRWKDLSPSKKIDNGSGEDTTTKLEKPPLLFASRSCNAISDIDKPDPFQDKRESAEKPPSETKQGAFVNESSRHNQANVHSYNSTSGKPVITRVKIIDPQYKDGSAKRVLVTDL